MSKSVLPTVQTPDHVFFLSSRFYTFPPLVGSGLPPRPPSNPLAVVALLGVNDITRYCKSQAKPLHPSLTTKGCMSCPSIPLLWVVRYMFFCLLFFLPSDIPSLLPVFRQIPEVALVHRFSSVNSHHPPLRFPRRHLVAIRHEAPPPSCSQVVPYRADKIKSCLTTVPANLGSLAP